MVADAFAHRPIVEIEKVAPLRVAYVDRASRRIDEVGEQDRRDVPQRREIGRTPGDELGDLTRQHIDVAGDGVHVDSADLHERCAGDLLGDGAHF